MPSDYRLHPALSARLLGAGLLINAVLVVGGTILIAALGLPAGFITVLVVAVFAVVGMGLYLARATVVHLDDEGYRVRFVRGAGVKQGRWVEVEDAVAADVAGSPCVLLRRQDGSTTAIPVDAIAGDRDAIVRDIQEHLQRGHGIRPIN